MSCLNTSAGAAGPRFRSGTSIGPPLANRDTGADPPLIRRLACGRAPQLCHRRAAFGHKRVFADGHRSAGGSSAWIVAKGLAAGVGSKLARLAAGHLTRDAVQKPSSSVKEAGGSRQGRRPRRSGGRCLRGGFSVSALARVRGLREALHSEDAARSMRVSRAGDIGAHRGTGSLSRSPLRGPRAVTNAGIPGRSGGRRLRGSRRRHQAGASAGAPTHNR